MSERNPRSKLRSMKRRYFWTTAAVYLATYLLAYIVLEVLFMIFEAGPYTRISAYVVLFIIAGVITDHIINKILKDRWLREAPDILDAIKAPEPAYIPDGTEHSEQTETPENKKSMRKLRRTQHKELEQEKAAAEASAPVPAQSKEKAEAKQPEGETIRKEPERRRLRRTKKTEEFSANSAGPKTEHPEEPDKASSWMKGLNEMDTVEFEDAVLALDPNRSEEKAALLNPSEQPSAENKKKPNRRRKTAAKGKPQNENRERSANTASFSEVNSKPKKQKRRPASAAGKPDSAEHKSPAPEPKPSAWTGKLEDMDTVEIEEAMERISAVTEDQNNRKK